MWAMCGQRAGNVRATSAPRLGNSLPPWEPKTTIGGLDWSPLGPVSVPTIDGPLRSEGEHFKVTSDHCPGRRAPGCAFYFPAQGAHFKTMRTLRDLESHGRCAPPPPKGATIMDLHLIWRSFSKRTKNTQGYCAGQLWVLKSRAALAAARNNTRDSPRDPPRSARRRASGG